MEERDILTSPLQKATTSNQNEILEKLKMLELKLNKLQTFQTQSSQLRYMHNNLLQHFKTTNNKTNEPELKLKIEEILKSLTESYKGSNLNSLTKTESKDSSQNQQSLDDLLTSLHNRDEVNQSGSEINQVSNREQFNKYHKKIKQLEIENDKLNELILWLIIQNICENKQEYMESMAKLENEKNELDEKLEMLKKTISYLTETNTALNMENKCLKRLSIFENELQDKYKNSPSVTVRNFSQLLTFLNGSNIPGASFSVKISSADVINYMDSEEKLSLAGESKDSFNLDRQIADWDLDEKNIQINVQKLGTRLRDMEVNQMKLNLIKRYVQKHGTKYINRNTLIDPCLGTGLWR